MTTFTDWHERNLRKECDLILGRTKTFDPARDDHLYDVVTSDDRASEHIETLIVALRKRQYVSPQQLADLADAIDAAVEAEAERKEALTR